MANRLKVTTRFEHRVHKGLGPRRTPYQSEADYLVAECPKCKQDSDLVAVSGEGDALVVHMQRQPVCDKCGYLLGDVDNIDANGEQQDPVVIEIEKAVAGELTASDTVEVAQNSDPTKDAPDDATDIEYVQMPEQP